jgi:hypothetical protein
MSRKKPPELVEINTGDNAAVATVEIPRALVRTIDQKIAASFGKPSDLSPEQMDLLQDIHILATALAEENSSRLKPILEHAQRRLCDAYAFLCEGRMQEARKTYDLANALLLDHTLRPRKAGREHGREAQRIEDEFIAQYYAQVRDADPTLSPKKARRKVRDDLDFSDDRGRKRVLDALRRLGRDR